MHATRLSILMFLILIGLSGCGASPAFPPPEPTAEQSWTMKLTQSGGFAGVHYEVQVTSAGDLIAEDERMGRTARLNLTPGQLSELDSLRQALTPSTTGRLPSACADCFIYELEIRSKSGLIQIQADDTTLGASGAQALIDYLRQLRDRALSSAI